MLSLTFFVNECVCVYERQREHAKTDTVAEFLSNYFFFLCSMLLLKGVYGVKEKSCNII